MAYELLVDSCAYFRLARAVNPLLGVPFGPPPAYTIYVVSELDDEYKRSPSLINKFGWVTTQPFVSNRQNNLIGTAIDAFELRETIAALTYYKDQKSYGVSRVDIVVLAVATVLNIPIITDDLDVMDMAREFRLPDPMGSVEALNWLHTIGALTLANAKATAQVWRGENDLPHGKAEFVASFLFYFGVRPW